MKLISRYAFAFPPSAITKHGGKFSGRKYGELWSQPEMKGQMSYLKTISTEGRRILTDTPRRSWFTTRRVVFIAWLLLGSSEIITVVSVIFWATQNFVILEAWATLGVLFFVVMTLNFLVESYESKMLNLVNRTPNPRITWLYLHFAYSLVGLSNVILLLLAFLSLVIPRAPLTHSFEAWMFFTGTTVFVVNFYSYFVLRLIGQAYEGPRGASFLGAAGLAMVAERNLSTQNIGGIRYLQESLAMLKALSQSWTFYASDLDRVLFTVSRLTQLDDPPFKQLEALSKPLTKLPHLDDLPDAFSTFLEYQKWSRGFEPHRIRRSLLGVRYTLTFLLTLFGIIVALYPSELRNTVAALGESIAKDPLILLALTFSIIAIVSGVIMMTYRVGLTDIRSFGDWPLALASVAVGIFWTLWLFAGFIENESLIAGLWYYPGAFLVALLASLATRRLRRRKKPRLNLVTENKSLDSAKDQSIH